MVTSYRDYTSPNTQFTYDMRNNVFYQKDDWNFINSLSIAQLNTLGNTSLLDIFLTTGNTVEPHIHQNAAELVYCISGEARVSLINPFTNELLNYDIKPRQVANIPQGWWHYELALTDDTHLLAIFDAPIPEVIFGSDILRLTPASVWAHTYCLDEAKVKDTFAPITKTVVIGPPTGCQQGQVQNRAVSSPYAYYGYSSQLPESYGYYDAGYVQQAPSAYSQSGGYPQYVTNPYHSGYSPQQGYPPY